MDPSVDLVELERALEPQRFGMKAARLARAEAAGLRVPPARVLSCAGVEAVVAGDAKVTSLVARAAREVGRYVAIRSSAPEEDRADASYAGLFTTILHVPSKAGPLRQAIERVSASAHSAAVAAYRCRRTPDRPPALAVLLQRMISARSAGVLFTRHPVTGNQEIVIESSWGLGEMLVSGRIVPDQFRVRHDGTLLDVRIGSKKASLVAQPGGGLRRIRSRRRGPSLTQRQVREVAGLGLRCELLFGFPSDVEWVYSKHGVLYLLQCRPITTPGQRSEGTQA
jgi:pyruvate,water dikinase